METINITFNQLFLGTFTLVIGFGVIQWLLSLWIKARLDKSIQHEYDKKLEEMKNILKDKYDLSKTEREFYDGIIEKIYELSSEIKKYEFENKKKVTNDNLLVDPVFKKKWFEFNNSASNFFGKSFVFLKDENYLNLKNSLNHSQDFAMLHNNLLEAMRKSIYPETKLNAKENLKDFPY